MRYDGQLNSPGAPGNRVGVYGDSIAGTWATRDFPQGQQPEADALFRRGIKGTPLEQRTQNLREVLKTNPGSLFAPQAGQVIGNMGGLLAQANPNAAFLGGPMQAGGIPPGFGMEAAPNVFSVRPRINYMDPEQGGLELGGAVNVPLGERGRINVQGGYQPDTRQLNVNATIGQPQGSPGFGIDFNMNRTLGGNRNNYGVMGRYGAQF
jgi:hypothetical protein